LRVLQVLQVLQVLGYLKPSLFPLLPKYQLKYWLMQV
jgi:hypothetical protein